jgi:hypothetical protein
MRRLGIAIIVLPLLTACAQTAEDGKLQPAPAPATDQPGVDWHVAHAGGVIVVELTDREGYYRVERVELVEPSGRSHPAHEMTRETVREGPGKYGSGVGVGGGYASGGHGGVGIGLSFPLAGSRRASVVTLTTAHLRPPDAAAYRRHVDQWAIRVVLADPAGATSFARIPAPAPAD